VPPPVHSSELVEEIAHEKALHCWAFKDALLTIRRVPCSCVMYSFKSRVDGLLLQFSILQSLGREEIAYLLFEIDSGWWWLGLCFKIMLGD